jgi:hypothetical protein
MNFFKKIKSITKIPRKILFLHVMKTAGTSFRQMLQEDLGCDIIFPSDSDLKKLPNGWYLLPEKILESYHSLPPHRILIGHFPAVILDKLPAEYSPAVFLRDPLQRSLSLIKYYSKIYKKDTLELISNEEFVGKYIKDYQTKILGMDAAVDPNIIYDVNQSTLMNALDRINSFDFVGVTEKFEESCKNFDKIYKTNTLSRIKKTNVSRTDQNELMEYKQIIDPLIKKDIIIYQAALERLKA